MFGFQKIQRVVAMVVMFSVFGCDAGDEGVQDDVAIREWCVEPAPAGLAGESNAVMSLVADSEELRLLQGFGVAINGQVADVRDDGQEGDPAAGDGSFSVPVLVDEAPADYQCYDVGSPDEIDDRGFELDCKPVPCPPDCKSILFGEPCVACFECSFKITLGQTKVE